MEKPLWKNLLVAEFTGVTIAAAKIAIDSVGALAYQENREKTALVQERIQGTKWRFF